MAKKDTITCATTASASVSTFTHFYYYLHYFQFLLLLLLLLVMSEATTRGVLQKSVLKNLAKFTGKDQKKRLQHSCFPFELHENFKNTFFTEYLLAIASLLDFTFLSIFSHSPFTFRLSVRFA